MRSVLTLLFVCLTNLLWCQKANILPTPQIFRANGSRFTVGASITLKIIPADSITHNLVTNFMSTVGIPICMNASREIMIKKVNDIEEAPVNKEEAYRLYIDNRKILIEAIDDEGVFRALQTVRQLIVRSQTIRYINGCKISDWPAFRIRGFMQDVGRGYIPISELKRELELLSHYKINVFQWHLTEDVAWRLESKTFPFLTDSLTMTQLKGDFYTQSEVRDLLSFCKQRYITVIPEIDMPGHSEAFSRASHYDMQSSQGMGILKIVMKEVCNLFSGVPYIHIGTDEVKFKNADFVPSMVTYLHSLGRKVITWDPGWHFRPGEIDMVELWKSGVPPTGVPAIDARYYYLNHFDSFADLSSVFFCKVLGSSSGNDTLAGAIASVWNDRMIMPPEKLLLLNNFYPVMLTLAERTWKGGGMGSYSQIGTRMPHFGSLWYKKFVDFEKRLLYQKKNDLKDVPFPYVRQANIRWRITDPFPNGGDLTKKFPPEFSLQHEYWYQGKEYKTKEAVGATIYLRHTWGPNISSAFYKDPKPDCTAYAYTWVYSPKQQNVGALIEFQDYSRTEKDLPPLNGTWDFKDSRVWVNGEEILPPIWDGLSVNLTHKPSFMNENCFARAPLPVTLVKGWNKVLLKLPVGAFTLPQVRLVKWMFTFAFVTLDGTYAVDNIFYSPDKIKSKNYSNE
jgi:hypothetical protein